MHLIQEKLLNLSKSENLAKLTLREMAAFVGIPDASPQQIKHHLLQLQKKKLISIDKDSGEMKLSSEIFNQGNLLQNESTLFSIPIVGAANCGPATIFAEQNYQGFLKVSSRLINRSHQNGLFAVRADGQSMNKSSINGKSIESGDYVIVDSEQPNIQTGDVVLVIIDGKATIKRLIDDSKSRIVVLKADSSFDYEPIYLHEEDEFNINGKVIEVIKQINNYQ